MGLVQETDRAATAFVDRSVHGYWRWRGAHVGLLRAASAAWTLRGRDDGGPSGGVFQTAMELARGAKSGQTQLRLRDQRCGLVHQPPEIPDSLQHYGVGER